MKYLKLFESYNTNIINICKKYGIKNYTPNSDGSIDVDGDVNLYNKGLTKLPLKFGHVGGHFDCGHNKLTSLEFSPKSVGGDFCCFGNPLHNVWKLISPKNYKWDSSIIELFNDYDCIREGDIIMVRFNDFLIDIGKDPVDKVEGYNNI